MRRRRRGRNCGIVAYAMAGAELPSRVCSCCAFRLFCEQLGARRILPLAYLLQTRGVPPNATITPLPLVLYYTWNCTWRLSLTAAAERLQRQPVIICSYSRRAGLARKGIVPPCRLHAGAAADAGRASEELAAGPFSCIAGALALYAAFGLAVRCILILRLIGHGLRHTISPVAGWRLQLHHGS